MKFSILQKFGFEKIQNLKFIKTTNSGGKRRMYFLDFFWNLLVLSLKEKYLKS
jgi:N6-adenosine-specific RNA methylase IME4